MIYLDHAAATPIEESAKEILKKSLDEDFANPSAAHKLGKQLSKRVDSARDFFLKSLNANGDLFFTSSATESNCTVILGSSLGKGDIIYFSSGDHPSLSVSVYRLQERGVELREIPLNDCGAIEIDKLLKELNENVKLILLSEVNNHSGNLHEITEISQKIKSSYPKCHVHVDSSQSFTKVPIDLSNGYVDSMTASAHKVGGPKGIAFLYLKNRNTIKPLLFGGGQEKGMRSSTVSAPLVFAFEEAAKACLSRIDSAYEHVLKLNELVEERLKEVAKFPFEGANLTPYILTFILPGVSSDIVLRHLEMENIFVSSSSACSSRVKGESVVFSALQLPKEQHKFVLRVSFSFHTKFEEVERFCDVLLETYDELKGLQCITR